MTRQVRGSAFLRLALGAALAASLASCRGADRRVLTVGVDQRPLTLDPHHHNDAVTWALQCNFYEGLVSFSPDLKVEPALAESWEAVAPDRWRFHLRRGVRFHHGETLRAADVVASFERVRTDPRSALRHYLFGVTRVAASDDLTVTVETDGPRPTLLNRLVFVPIVTERDARSAEIAEPNGTGPYRVVRHDDPDSLTAQAWPGWRGLPEVREVRFVFDVDNQRLFQRFLRGEIDVMRSLPEGQVSEMGTFPHVRAEAQPRLTVQMLVISAPGSGTAAGRALADVRVRRAILLGCNRRRLADEVFAGTGEVASQYVHPAVFGYDPSISPEPFDPAGARALLAEAGFPDGFEVTIRHTRMQAVMVPSLVSDLGAIGVRATPHEVRWEEMMALMREAGNEVAPFAWSCTTGDAGDFLTSCVHSPSLALGLGRSNYARFRDARVDALIEEAERELDAGRRRALLQEAQRRTLAALPYLPLLERSLFMGVSDRVDVVRRDDQWLWVAAYRWRSAE